VKVFYDPNMAATGTTFDTTRKAEQIAKSLADQPIDDVDVAVIHPSILALTENLIAQVHDLAYVRAVVTGRPDWLAASSGLAWDDGIYRMAVAHCAAVVAAVADAVESGLTGGALSSGLHHARSDHGKGYCTFSGLAIAAWWVRLNHPDIRVGILDVDAHFGGGTRQIIEHMVDVHQVDVSTNRYDRYEHRDALLAPVSGYLPVVDAAITTVLSHHPDIVICNMGVDPFDDGVTPEVLAERDRLVAHRFDTVEVPAVFTLAGGYCSDRLDMDGLVGLHRATIAAFANP
jgi:acetoin utilization deacetylase AcuC-like enzyme